MKVKRSNYLTIPEQAALIAATDNYLDRALFMLALSSGIRRDDLILIHVKNVDLEARTLNFWEQKKRRWLKIPLSAEVADELGRFIKTLPEDQLQLFKVSSKTVYNRLQRTLKRAGIRKEISVHDLRRSFIKTGLKRGIPREVMAMITGDRLETIDEYYNVPDLEEMREAVKDMKINGGGA